MATTPDPHGPPRRFAAFLGEVISAASASPVGSWRDLAVRRRRRPEHKRGLSRLRVRVASDERMEWGCPVCDDHGTIGSWRGSPFHLSGVRDRGNRPTRTLLVSKEEYDAIRDSMRLEAESARIVSGATPVARGVVLSATADDFAGLADSSAFDANHEATSKRQRALDPVRVRLEGLRRR